LPRDQEECRQESVGNVLGEDKLGEKDA